MSACLLAMLACDGGVRAFGRVTDSGGHPINGAKVTLVDRHGGTAFTGKTQDDGTFHLSLTVAPGFYNFTLTVSCDGYKPCSAEVRTIRNNRVQIVLATAIEKGQSRIIVTEAPPNLRSQYGKPICP